MLRHIKSIYASSFLNLPDCPPSVYMKESPSAATSPAIPVILVEIAAKPAEANTQTCDYPFGV